MTEKTCKKCNQKKPAAEFNKEKLNKDGLKGACRSCHNEESRKWYQDNKKRKAATDRHWQESNPKRCAYAFQKNQAKQRGIEFLLTFEEWRDWWGNDFANRGCAKGKLVMARRGDEGPYKLGNIKKITCSENSVESNRVRKHN